MNKYKSNYEKLNELNQADYGQKTTGDFRRQIDKDLTHDNLKLENPSYHNTYYLGKGRYGTRTLKMKNTEYLKLNNNYNEKRIIGPYVRH